MGCPSLEEPSSRSTQRWCRYCEVTGAQDGTQHSKMESLWSKHADGRCVPTRNSLEMRGEPGSSSSRLKLAGGGRARPSSSSSWLPTPSLGQLLCRCVARPELHGSVVGVPYCLAQQPGRMRYLCWSGQDGVAPHLHEVRRVAERLHAQPVANFDYRPFIVSGKKEPLKIPRKFWMLRLPALFKPKKKWRLASQVDPLDYLEHAPDKEGVWRRNSSTLQAIEEQVLQVMYDPMSRGQIYRIDRE